MNGLVENKLSTKLVSAEENLAGELIIKMKRGDEEKIVTYSPGYEADIYDAEFEWRQFDMRWTQERFDKYWDNGGEEKEIQREIEATVDMYDDELTWGELGQNF